jgi:hypothetical protein
MVYCHIVGWRFFIPEAVLLRMRPRPPSPSTASCARDLSKLGLV